MTAVIKFFVRKRSTSDYSRNTLLQSLHKYFYINIHSRIYLYTYYIYKIIILSRACCRMYRVCKACSSEMGTNDTILLCYRSTRWFWSSISLLREKRNVHQSDVYNSHLTKSMRREKILSPLFIPNLRDN